MKVHRHLVEEIITALAAVFAENQRADKVIERALKSHRKWGSRDRRFFAENVYEVVRWRRLLAALGGSEDLWRIWNVHWLRKFGELPGDWPQSENLDYDDLRRREKNLPPAVRESFPEELYELAAQELGADWPAIARALNQPADVYLRTNTLRTTPAELLAALTKEAISVQLMKDPELPAALRLTERKNTFTTEAFRKGLFEVQDAASQRIAPLLDVQPGHRVIDACAGGGGKTLHLAALMRNKGKIIAMDVHDWKLQELKLRARRNSVDIIETRVIESSKTIKRLAASADRVLLDVPCSGIGVLRRNPDAKWKLSATEIGRLRVLQAEILDSYSQMVKVGGKLVYATCSLLPSENEKQVAAFLETRGEQWSLEKELHLRPDREGFDGFYAALLVRKS